MLPKREDCLMQFFNGMEESSVQAPQPATRLDLRRILQARQCVSREFLNSPAFDCITLGDLLGCEIVIKLETANPIGCFKGRGTEVVMSRLARTQSLKVVVCASAGNLGLALAYSGRRHGVNVTVVASASANATKIDRIRKLGAAVEQVAGDFEAARERAREIADNNNVFLVEDSDNLDTCEGAGTIGLELLEGGERIDAVLLALGGGALATGVGHVFKTLSPATEVVCVQPKGAPAMALSWRARSIVNTEHTDTIADGVAGRFPSPAVLADLLANADHIPVVDEDSIVTGMRMLYRTASLVVEPSAALGVAAILEDPLRYRGKRVAMVICGSNVQSEQFSAWMQE
ncbi:threonine ammonia-lyase [Aspergillus lucknowensis]|uniref:Tryptophan synthase beta subunit-like PLP-dependent enzyme n=1 Tax=Aspergillus lucknowensis TaxID=176173 RepID=A0ABR4LSC0_9EURO